MSLIRNFLGVVALAASTVATSAETPSLICFGNEPSWHLDFSGPAAARLVLPDQKPVGYQGSETRLYFLGERAWRGKTADGKGDSLVAFLREVACSDGMSEIRHPLLARVSLPDGRFLAGCCRVPAAPAAPAPAVLEGPTWKLAALAGYDAGSLAALRRPVTLRFAEGRIEGFSGCNRLFGNYTVDRDKLVLGRLAGTMMACPGPAMKIENVFKSALNGDFRFLIGKDRLTLTPPAGAPLEFQVAPEPELDGVTWDVTGFNNGRQAVVSPLLGTRLNLSFKDGMVQGFSGCNKFRASYKREGDRLTIAPLATTRMACAAEGLMQQEREFLAALESVTVWTIRDGMLDMHRADGERALTANLAGK
ncbi:MAG: META domain-containing protein [Azonexus sp.]